MSDIADILGISSKPVHTITDEANKIMNQTTNNVGSANDFKRRKKPKGMNREIFDLMGSDTLIASMQSNLAAPSFKNKRLNALKGKWLWVPINNSARIHNDPIFFHWVKADLNYIDYPYAKFNVKIDSFEYSDEEYDLYLIDKSSSSCSSRILWTKEDTNQLIKICHQYDLRWPIIHDRIELNTNRSIEELQARYYYVRMIIKQLRTNNTNNNSNVLLKYEMNNEENMNSNFDIEQEIKRRKIQDHLFRKTRKDEAEELQLREELKLIEVALKKTKKMKSNNTNSSATTTSNATIHNTSNKSNKQIINNIRTTNSNTTTNDENLKNKQTTKSNLNVDIPLKSILYSDTSIPSENIKYNNTNAKKPLTNDEEIIHNIPRLQSSRLYTSNKNINTNNILIDMKENIVTQIDSNELILSKKLIDKMNAYLKELEIPENPLPTGAVCDLVDSVKQKTITLLSLHNIIRNKEKELKTLQSQIFVVNSSSKSGGNNTQRSKPSNTTTNNNNNNNNNTSNKKESGSSKSKKQSSIIYSKHIDTQDQEQTTMMTAEDTVVMTQDIESKQISQDIITTMEISE